jgi:uncharacterized protein YndB with AHSA1/START domain
MRVEASVLIDATPNQVFGFITVPDQGPRWQEGAISTRVTTPGPVALGSRMEHLGKWLWMRIPTTAVVTLYEPDRRYGYDITSKLASAPSLMRYELEPALGGTRLTLSNEAPIGGLMKVLEPVFERSVQHMFERDVARLKVVIEHEIASSASAALHAQNQQA